MKRSEAIRFRQYIDKIIAELSDADALDVLDLFLPWKPDTWYEIGEKRKDDGELYRCEQAHTSQAHYPPKLIPAIWTKISVDEWPAWKQPYGSVDAYRIGAKVSHTSKHWINGRDYNTREPGTFDSGWSEAE